MNNKLILGGIAVAVIAGGAYWTFAQFEPRADTNYMPITSGENPEPGSTVHDLPVEPAAAAARKDLAAKLSAAEKSIVILNIENKTWTDGCLGLGGPAESCMLALVDGFRVELLAKGKSYFYRTDNTGASLRAETN